MGKMRARVKGRAVALLPESGRLEPSESRSFSGEAEDVQPVCLQCLQSPSGLTPTLQCLPLLRGGFFGEGSAELDLRATIWVAAKPQPNGSPTRPLGSEHKAMGRCFSRLIVLA